jgi:hypothetical protein
MYHFFKVAPHSEIVGIGVEWRISSLRSSRTCDFDGYEALLSGYFSYLPRVFRPLEIPISVCLLLCSASCVLLLVAFHARDLLACTSKRVRKDTKVRVKYFLSMTGLVNDMTNNATKLNECPSIAKITPLPVCS